MKGFLILQLSIAATLVCVAIALFTSAARELDRPLGVRVDGVTTATIQLPIVVAGERWRHYPTPRFAADADRLLTMMQSKLPNAHVAIIADVPITRRERPSVALRSAPAVLYAPVYPTTLWDRREGDLRVVYLHRVSPGFFQTMGGTFVSGHDFSASAHVGPELLDRWDLPRGVGVAVIDRRLATSLSGSPARALGRLITLETDLVPARRVLGVVDDIRLNPVDDQTSGHVYIPFSDNPLAEFTLVVCCEPVARVRESIGDLRQSWFSSDGVTSLRDLLRTPLAAQRLAATALSAFAVTAILVCALTLFGATASAAKAGQEGLAIRLALGADHRDLQRALWQRVAAYATVGTTSGVLFAFWLIRSFAWGTGDGFGAAIIPTMAVMAITVICAVAPTARRLRTLDPLLLLRECR